MILLGSWVIHKPAYADRRPADLSWLSTLLCRQELRPTVASLQCQAQALLASHFTRSADHLCRRHSPPARLYEQVLTREEVLVQLQAARRHGPGGAADCWGKSAGLQLPVACNVAHKVC